jgi:hypothetical protein
MLTLGERTTRYSLEQVVDSCHFIVTDRKWDNPVAQRRRGERPQRVNEPDSYDLRCEALLSVQNCLRDQESIRLKFQDCIRAASSCAQADFEMSRDFRRDDWFAESSARAPLIKRAQKSIQYRAQSHRSTSGFLRRLGIRVDPLDFDRLLQGLLHKIARLGGCHVQVGVQGRVFTALTLTPGAVFLEMTQRQNQVCQVVRAFALDGC